MRGHVNPQAHMFSYFSPERVVIKNAVIQASNFHDYPILRMSETPEIATKVLSTDNEMSGVSEIGLTLVGAAINNALSRLIGKHLTRMPMLAEDVLRAVKA
jgi:CO/xanthine dehydrogenase Mo-binding subunit